MKLFKNTFLSMRLLASLLFTTLSYTACAQSAPAADTASAIIYKATSDTVFNKGSGIEFTTLTPAQVHHLEVLGKTWGFLKYYHPAIASGHYNWDYELFRILPSILKVRSNAERNELLLNWVNRLPLPAGNKAGKADKGHVKMQPDLAWIADENELGTDLPVALKRVKDFNRTGEHYYVGRGQAGNPSFNNEASYSTMLYPDAGFRLLALFRYWNMIQYFYPYKYLITEGWNNILPTYIPIFAGAKDIADYQTSLLRLVSSIHDSHGYFYGANLYVQRVDKTNNIPLRIKFIEDKPVVIKARDESTGLRKGDVITAINGQAVADVVKGLLPVTSASNYPTQLNRIENTLFRRKDSVVQVTYERDGAVNIANITMLPSVKAGVKPDLPANSWKLIGDNVAYVYPGLFKNKQMDSMTTAFIHTKGLVIDMRCYPSDNLLPSLVEYVLPHRQPFVKFTIGSLTQPGQFTEGFTMWAGKRNKDYYRGKVIILVNEETQSNAEFITMALRLAPKAVVLGSTTAGADGNISKVPLPGGLETIITGIGVYYPDGRETQRVGIIPDIELRPTVKGIRENRDEVLEKALSIIRE